MVDVAPSPGLDGPALGPNRDPQGHLRSPVSKLKASLWVPGGVDSTAECLKFEKIQNVCSFLNFCQWQKSVWTVDALSLSLLRLPRGEIGPELWNQNSKRCSAAADTFGKIGNKILFHFSFLLPYWLQISRNIPFWRRFNFINPSQSIWDTSQLLCECIDTGLNRTLSFLQFKVWQMFKGCDTQFQSVTNAGELVYLEVYEPNSIHRGSQLWPVA